MKEKEIEDIICRVPSLIEDGLTFKGRQVYVSGKYVDLLFHDRNGHELIVELKRGTIVRKDIAQILDYEGFFLKQGTPDIRVMLIGTRVPENFRRSLDHHGFEWKELTLSDLSPYMTEEQLSSVEKKTEKATRTYKTSQSNNTDSKRNFTLSRTRESFWTTLLEKAQAEIPLNFPSPSKPNAVYASAGKTGMKWVFAIKQNESWVELEIMLPGDKSKSHNVFSQLNLSKREIESALGDSLRWERIEDRKSCRIQTNPREKYGVENINQWELLQNNLVKKMKNMVNVFTPHIKDLKPV